MTPELKTVLVNKSVTGLSLELNSFAPKASPRMRGGSPYALVPVNLKPLASLDIQALLNCDKVEAARVIDRTPQLQALVRRGLLEVV